MNGEAILFFLFAGICLGGAVLVVTMRNPMYSALSLLATFLSMAALFFLQHAEFLGVVQIFVYGGGIMVLFLFVIMLVNLQNLQETRLFLSQARWAWLLIVGMASLVIVLFLGLSFEPPLSNPAAFEMVEGESLGNTQAVAWVLYREYLLPFEIASVFLLVAMMGAVILGRRT